MMRILRLAAIAVLVSAGLASSTAFADNGVTRCSGTLAAGTYQNVVVPAGAGCRLDSATITGNFTSSGAGDSVILTNTTVGGNVTITGMLPNPDRSGIVISGDAIFGNVTVSDNVPEWGLILGDCHPSGHPDTCNTIGGNVTFNNNAPQEGVGRVTLNAIGGNLVGNGNRFYGNVLLVAGNTLAHNLIFNDNSGSIQFGFYVPNSAGGNMVCQNNTGFATSGNNTAKHQVIGCN